MSEHLRRVQKTARRAAEMRVQRDQAIREAIKAGESQVAVARAAGLSRARIQQILVEA